MLYIVNSRGEVVASANGDIDTASLAARGLRVVSSDLALAGDRAIATGPPDQLRIVERAQETRPLLVMRTEAKDDDGDGVAEIAANGKSVAVIHVTAQTAEGEVLGEDVPITFRTTAGHLSARTVDTKKGAATVRLTSTRETVLAQVVAMAPGFEPAHLEIEFVP